ncbi:MAG: hypothetical protein LBK55_01585 [Azoarcus sp.]|jgi:hypothetical protein|nr:hypothetical protein [Azoarcus sp.]
MATANGMGGSHRGWLASAMLAGAAVWLAGCETLFDAPPSPETLRQESMARKMSDFVSGGEQTAGAMPPGLKEVGIDPRDAPDSPAGAMNSAADKLTGRAADSAAGAARKGVAGLAASANAAAAASDAESAPQTETPVGREIPVLTFERAEADMPHLVVRSLDDAVFRVDGKKMELGGMTRAGRIGLIAPGRHVLSIECPRDPPFSADFYLKKNERIVVRGSCSPPPASNSGR